MTPKLTLTIAAGIGLVFSSVMFFMPGLLFLLHGSPADGQIPQKLVTLRYVVASLIFALAVISFQFRNIEGVTFQKDVMLGYSIGSCIICLTAVLLQVSSSIPETCTYCMQVQLTGNISAIPSVLAAGIICVLSFLTFLELKKNEFLD
tara:strand:+ start:442 stop:885 length:444 start_codon:yes stop_codon:yes gene_type:complete